MAFETEDRDIPKYRANSFQNTFPSDGILRLIWPSVFALRAMPWQAADAHYTVSAPYGLLTRWFGCRRVRFPLLTEFGSLAVKDTIFHQRRGIFGYRFPLFR